MRGIPKPERTGDVKIDRNFRYIYDWIQSYLNEESPEEEE